MDKDYQGGLDFLRAITHRKKPIRGIVDWDDEVLNKKLSKDRILDDNILGRMG